MTTKNNFITVTYFIHTLCKSYGINLDCYEIRTIYHGVNVIGEIAEEILIYKCQSELRMVPTRNASILMSFSDQGTLYTSTLYCIYERCHYCFWHPLNGFSKHPARQPSRTRYKVTYTFV